jgi:hypothetical protein
VQLGWTARTSLLVRQLVGLQTSNSFEQVRVVVARQIEDFDKACAANLRTRDISEVRQDAQGLIDGRWYK